LGQVIEDNDLIAFVHKLVNANASNIPCAARNKYVHAGSNQTVIWLDMYRRRESPS